MSPKRPDRQEIFRLFAESLVSLFGTTPFRCAWDAPPASPMACRQSGPTPTFVAFDSLLSPSIESHVVNTYEPYTIRHHLARGTPVAATVTLADTSGALILSVDLNSEPPDLTIAPWSVLVSVTDLRLLHAALRSALTSHGRTGLGEVRDAAHERGAPLLKRLRAVTNIWNGTQTIECGREASVWLMQELLGAGWRCAEVVNQDFRLALKRLVHDLRAAVPVLKPDAPLQYRALPHITHATAVETLCALLDPALSHGDAIAPRPPGQADDKDAVVLAGLARSLPAWTRAHAVARALVNLGDASPGISLLQAQNARRSLLSATSSAVHLWAFVAQELDYSSQIDPGARSQRLATRRARPKRLASDWEGETAPRALAALWFSLGFLDRLAAPAILEELAPPACVALLADYTYVVRECVRVQCFGRRADFVAQDAALASALATVVRYHAEHVVGLSSRYEIGEILRRLGTAEGLNHGVQPTEHLRHALETYICGHQVLELCATSTDRKQGTSSSTCARLADVLASRGAAHRGSAAGDDLRQAFSLAALFHDIGYLLFPTSARPARALTQRDPRLATAFEELDSKLAAAAAALMPGVVRALVEARYCDAANEPDFARWLAQQATNPRPDHGVLSGYFLHQVCSRVPSSSASVQRQAVRAALLHNTGLSIAMRGDPAAGLLVLCNELFEWEPERSHHPSPSTVDSVFHVMISEAGYRPLRHRALGLPLERCLEPETHHRHSELMRTAPHAGVRHHFRARAAERRASPTFATLDIYLREPRYLDAPVYHLWLVKAQRLGRIKDHPAWAPRLRMHVPRDSRLQGQTMRDVLERVVGRLRSPHQGALEEWLRNLRRRPADQPPLYSGIHWETLWLGHETRLADDVDLFALLADIDREVDAVLGRGL